VKTGWRALEALPRRQTSSDGRPPPIVPPRKGDYGGSDSEANPRHFRLRGILQVTMRQLLIPVLALGFFFGPKLPIPAQEGS
jgi:hypothetical protein